MEIKKEETIQINFNEDISDLRTINVSTDEVDSIIIEDGFLKVHEISSDVWHCYNVNTVAHFHYPDKRRKKINDQRKHRSSN